MPKVWIISPGDRTAALPPFVSAMQQAIQQASAVQPSSSAPAMVDIQVIAAAELETAAISPSSEQTGDIFCPLTLDVPAWLSPFASVFQQCQNQEPLRATVASWQIAIGEGNLWLPIVLTAKGPLYGEAIAQSGVSYQQPVHLSDAQRQPLYALGQRLLRSQQAPPAVYLLQFGCEEHTIWFDRLIPFPAEPAIASLNTQTPDLFTCHWRCLTHQPIPDLLIATGAHSSPLS